MCVIMLVCWVPLSAVDPQAFGVSFISPRDLPNMTVSVTLAHSWDSGCLLPRADIPYPLSLARRQPAQISWPSFLLCMEGPGLEQRLRGWNGDRIEREGENEGAHLNRYFLSLLPLLSFSPYYQSVWCQTCPIWGERRDTKCRQILKVAADYFKRRKYQLLLWGLSLIRLSAAGVKEGTQVLLFEKIQTSYAFICYAILPVPDPSRTIFINSHFFFTCQHVSRLLDFNCLAVQYSRAPAALNAPNISDV